MIRVIPPKRPSTAAPAPDAEPEKKIIFIMQTLDGLKLAPFGSIELPVSLLEQVTEAIEAIADTAPEISIQVGRPGTRLIVTEVVPEDPDYIGGENKLNFGEVLTVPEVVAFLSQKKQTSPQLIRYYLKQSTSKAFKKFGYTFRDVEDFKRELSGPSGKHLHPIAEANIAWAKEYHQEPLT